MFSENRGRPVAVGFKDLWPTKRKPSQNQSRGEKKSIFLLLASGLKKEGRQPKTFIKKKHRILQQNPARCMTDCALSVLSQVWGIFSVVDKVHRSSTWVKVQIGIIQFYSSKSKSTAFSILLKWKYKSTQFFMYLSKKVLIDRFILQFYIDYFILY